MTRPRQAPNRRPSPAAKTRRKRIRPRLRRRLSSLTRKVRRTVRRRMRRAWRRSLRRYATWRRRQLARRARADRERQGAAQQLAVRSITGKPRPAKNASPTPGTQQTKRTRDGKFNGSSTTGKRTAAKKTAAKKTAMPIAQRDLARGDAALRRIEGRLGKTEKRIDGMF